ncbi:MAG: hypothetical protein EU539_06030 [Promethearchaeota archaeon]|nr:MAG: hypothetical protein EU539_06030 [Candidatus Lokiarchaeota archaeon]
MKKKIDRKQEVINKMFGYVGDFLKNLFQIKFAEETSLNAFDFERSYHDFLIHLNKRPHGKYKWAEIDNESSDDFKKSLMEYFK